MRAQKKHTHCFKLAGGIVASGPILSPCVFLGPRQRAIGFLRADPHATMIAIEQNDLRGRGPRPCMRAADLAIFEEEGSWSGPLLRAVNYVADAVAAAFPKRQVRVSTLAYVHTQDPPKHTLPRDNVVIRLVGYHCGWGALGQRDLCRRSGLHVPAAKLVKDCAGQAVDLDLEYRL